MKHKKSEMTYFAKRCAVATRQMINGICMSEDISHDEIGREILHGNDPEILMEVSKRFAKYTKETEPFDTENGDVQDFQHIIEIIIDCCEENGYFENEVT